MLLALLDIVIAATDGRPGEDGEPPVKLDLRGGACILVGTLTFVVLGDRRATLIGSTARAAGLTLAGGVVFTVLLKIPFQFFQVF